MVMVTARFAGIGCPGVQAFPPELYENALPVLISVPRSNQLLGQDTAHEAGSVDGTAPCWGKNDPLETVPKHDTGLQVVYVVPAAGVHCVR